MTEQKSQGGDLFIVDNSDADWKVKAYLQEWCEIAHSFDIATAYFEIGALLALDGEWQKLDKIRVLMGDEVTARTRRVIVDGVRGALDTSLDREKRTNDFLVGVPAITEALRSGKIECRVYTKAKFHAKTYITHARSAVVGSRALVGSSNLTLPGLTANVELNVQIRTEVDQLQEWFERHWDEAQDVTGDILTVIERHTTEFTPFEVYAKSLQEYFKGHEQTVTEWERSQSKIWQILDEYQREGYQALMKIAETYNGAFLCDGVGLGKTFVGLMLIERLLHDGKNVALFVTKAANDPVWQAALRRYLPELMGRSFNHLQVFNHTDLLRGAEMPEELGRVKEMAHAVVIDEAHHFRNRGTAGIGQVVQPSRYHAMFDLLDGKQVFMLTATPVNNSLRDLQHMIELFSRRQQDYFKDAPLGIHSLQGHFRQMEKQLELLVAEQEGERATSEEDEEQVTDDAEASSILLNDSLSRALVVQRSRRYVQKSQEQQHGAAAIFPVRQPPIVVDYSLKQTYGPTLDYVEKAFGREEPLFFLTAYYPLKHYIGDPAALEDASGAASGVLSGLAFQANRQKQVARLIRIQFLKRFESSARAFEGSCESLLRKLYAFAKKNCSEPDEQEMLRKWELRQADVIAGVIANWQATHATGDEDEDEDEELVPDDVIERMDALPRTQFDVPKILSENFMDLDEICRLLERLQQFTPEQDDKLGQLRRLLRSKLLANEKVLIFSEFMDTARYLKAELTSAGIGGVDEVDSSVKGDRREALTRFAPYYNGSSPVDLAAKRRLEIRVLIATDVLSEGLNLQDATYLINYDLHWNPVRLMQRIGRVDRRLDPQIEARIAEDDPERAERRGLVCYWNFLPPGELDNLLHIYGTLSRKALRISKTFGIEGRKLLRPEDDYDALREFNEVYEGAMSSDEEMHLAYQQLLREHPGLEQKLNGLPNRIFSGKSWDKSQGQGRLLSDGARAVFFCYALPGHDRKAEGSADEPWAAWTEAAGVTAWYLYDLDIGRIFSEAPEIFAYIECAPDTPRQTAIDRETLVAARKKVDEHIKNTYLRQTDAPVGVSATLKAWMELS